MSERLIMKQTLTCPSCGQPLAANALQGLCPACLLKAGLGSNLKTAPETNPATPSVPPGGAAPMPSEVATSFPQLEVLGLLGQGGMGAVYKARQKALDRVVALKILPPAVGDDPAFAERFAREAKALARLNHPGIVTLYEFGQANGLYYFLMEFVDGVNLRQLLQASRLSPREALAIVPQICDALQYAHDQGIVHRDIKPENILLDRQGRVKVADFGLAKLVGGPTDPAAVRVSSSASPVLTEAGKVLGTPRYIAPEQLDRPGEVDHRADIYSLGVVFYQMLTGQLPEQRIDPPSRKVRLDVRLDEVVLRALEKEPKRRYQQVSQVKTAVESINATSDRAVEPGTTPSAATTPWSNFVASLLGVPFTSPWAIKLANLSALGCLASLGFLPLPIPGWEGMFGFSGLFGLIGVAFIMERVARRKRPPSGPGRTSTVDGTQPNVSNPDVSTNAPEDNSLKLHTAFRWRWTAGATAGLLVLGTLVFVWVQRAQPLDTPLTSDSPRGEFSALASTWRAMRFFGPDLLSYRFSVQGRGGAAFQKWEVPVPVAELTDIPQAQPWDHYSFEKHGRIRWSEDGTKVSFRVRDVEVSAFNTVDKSFSSQEGFSPVREVTLLGGTKLQDCFIDLETGRVRSAPTEMVESLRAHHELGHGSPTVPRVQAWMRTNGLDLVKRVLEEGVMQVGGASIMMAEKSGPHANQRGFDTISTDQVVRAAAEAERVMNNSPGAEEPPFYWLDHRAVYAFKTREGSAGLLEVVEDKSRSDKTRVRYKLVRFNDKFTVDFREVRLGTAINAMAKQAKVNCTLDPNLPFLHSSGDGRPTSEPLVTVHWEGVTARQAFDKLLSNYNLRLIGDSKTGIGHITTNNVITDK